VQLVRGHRNIEWLRFKVYTPRPGVAERTGQRGARDVEGLLGDELLNRTADSVRLVRELLRHDPRVEHGASKQVRAREFLALGAPPLKLTDGQVVGVCSKCSLRGGRTAHLPLMDFRVTPGPDSLAAIKHGLRALGESRGVILTSGRSYHYYGWRLLSESGWRSFMASSILLAPLTDTRYIGHRLFAGTAALRLTSADSKPVVPRVVAVI